MCATIKFLISYTVHTLALYATLCVKIMIVLTQGVLKYCYVLVLVWMGDSLCN